MNDFDKAGRYLIKRNPSGFFRWLLRRPQVAFRAWIDARRLALPDQGDLTNDLVAALTLGNTREALCLEIQAASAPGAADRLLLGYVPRLLSEPDLPAALAVSVAGGAVINLTGPAQSAEVEYRLRAEPACWLAGGILQRTLREEEAKQTLVEMTPGNLSRWLLAWLPLMQGGATAAIIAGWKREASKEPNLRDRHLLAHLTLTFAKLAECQEAWAHELEGWAVIKSEYLEELREQVRAEGRVEGRVEGRAEGRVEGRAEGRAEGLRDTILTLGQKRLGKVASRSQKAQLKALTDQARLQRMRDRLFEAVSWDDLLNTP